MLSGSRAQGRAGSASTLDANEGDCGEDRMTDTDRERIYNVLFLCTGNSARSILAEAILNRAGQGRFRAYSAGSHPKGRVHPMALEVLRARHHDTSSLHSKSWDEFAKPGAPALDFVFTVCDNAASELCPTWPGQPMTARWGVADPAAFEGPPETQRRVFVRTYLELSRRIDLFLALPLTSIDRLSLKARLDEIGKSSERNAHR
jgi:arsenate reductase